MGQTLDVLNAAASMTDHIQQACCNAGTSKLAVEQVFKWCPPTNGWIEINADGAADMQEEWSATGGMIRDSNGRWIVGYQRYLGRESVL